MYKGKFLLLLLPTQTLQKMRIKPPKIIRKLYPSFIWNFPDEKDGIFLTFDDGPRPEVTPWVLDLLDKYNAKATFFVVDNGRYGDLKKIAAAGHSIGIHTISHDYKKIYASEDAFFNDL